ncbi:MAG TPA: nitroreductase family protein [Acidimicrobiales bacterium]
MVDLLEGLLTTRAIRRFTAEPVAEHDLSTMLFAATRAPSGSNRQPFRFLVLRDGPKAVEAKRLLGRAFRQGWAEKSRAGAGDSTGQRAVGETAGDNVDERALRRERTARAMQHFVDHFEEIPVVVLACLNRYRSPQPSEGASVYPACQNLLLAARALGYGGVMTMWHAYVEDDLRQLLRIPSETAISATIPLGRPQGSHGPVRRKPLPELVFEDEWGAFAPWAADPVGTRYTG